MTSLQGGLSIRQRGRQWGIGRAEPCAGPACCSLPPPRLLSCDPPRLPARPAAQGRQWALLACSRRCTGSPRAAAGGRQRGPTCRPRRAPGLCPGRWRAPPPSTPLAPAQAGMMSQTSSITSCLPSGGTPCCLCGIMWQQDSQHLPPVREEEAACEMHAPGSSPTEQNQWCLCPPAAHAAPRAGKNRH